MSQKISLNKTHEDLAAVIDRIKADSPVGIDTQLTHAIIIDYLQQLTERIQRIEKRLDH